MGVTAFSDRNKMTNVWQKAVGVVDFENCPFQGLHLNLFNTDIPSGCHDVRVNGVTLTQRIAMMAPAIGVQAFLTDAKTLDMCMHSFIQTQQIHSMVSNVTCSWETVQPHFGFA